MTFSVSKQYAVIKSQSHPALGSPSPKPFLTFCQAPRKVRVRYHWQLLSKRLVPKEDTITTGAVIHPSNTIVAARKEPLLQDLSKHSDQAFVRSLLCQHHPVAAPTQGGHIQDLHNLLQGMTLSDSSFDTVTWSRKTTEESISLSRSSFTPSTSTSTRSVPKNKAPIPPSTSARSTATPSHPHPQASSMVVQTPRQVTASIPIPSAIRPPRADQTPEGFWVITVGQEVGVFYRWADVAERTNFISASYDEGRVRAVPLAGGPFWPSPPESSPNPPSPTLSMGSSASEDSLWLQVEDLTETMSQL
ncbi:hypothetical protein DEU56DRAFT_920062 [Suillus clintonianus]|uniref:uncharacterized protein n=1 Tax=Suillus clintonianus TaxID=1904413 RepID=UPI001B86F5FD|nr:uncharacterized protein DEU56DRAFT_920062 [Suillus clintonianus]KAG2111365.1 hypothetical protein DEU56DRAFT_920062 [Suillus clintonianus]